MHRIFIDGFEGGGTGLWDLTGANASVVSSSGLDMDGNYCLDLTTTTAYVSQLIASTDEIYTAFLWRPSAPSTLQSLIGYYSGTVSRLINFLRNNSTNVIDVRTDSGVLVSGTKTISNDTTYLVEIYVKIADSGGRVVVKFDGVTDIDFTGDTKHTTNTLFNYIKLGYSSSTYYAKAYFDNFILDDTEYPSDTNIQVIALTGAGNSTQWTPSAGNNWDCVEEIPKNDADYVYTNGVNNIDTYVAGNLTGTINSIKCVQIQVRQKYPSWPNNFNLVVRCNGTDYLSSNLVSTSSWKNLFYIWENNPDDSAAWEETDVNAAEIGIKNLVGNVIYASQLLAQVEWAEVTAEDGWTGTINGISSTNIAKINGIPIANIAKVNGV